MLHTKGKILRHNELNTPLLLTTTAVTVHLSVSTHVARRSTWQQGPLWQYYPPSCPFHTLSICSLFLIRLFPALCFIYSTLFNNISFCSLSSGSLKWCPRAQSGPLHYNCINWSLQMISVWQCAAFLCGLFQCHFIMFTQLFLLYKGLINILTLWEGKIQDPVISRLTHIFPLCNS